MRQNNASTANNLHSKANRQTLPTQDHHSGAYAPPLHAASALKRRCARRRRTTFAFAAERFYLNQGAPTTNQIKLRGWDIISRRVQAWGCCFALVDGTSVMGAGGVGHARSDHLAGGFLGDSLLCWRCLNAS